MLRALCVWGLLCVGVACGGDDDGACVGVACGGDDDGGPVGRGSAACQDWQDAICDFVSDRCGTLGRTRCDEQYQGTHCLSDAEASRCSNLFNTATCSSVTQSEVLACDIQAIADPAPAQAACRGLLDRICTKLIACSPGVTHTQCLAQQQASINCNNALSYTLGYEECLTTIDALTCPITSIPAACDGVIKLTGI